MATVQIRNLPDESVATLKVRAAKAGQSLQEYMREFLIEETSRPTVKEFMEQLLEEFDPDGPEIPAETIARGIDDSWS